MKRILPAGWLVLALGVVLSARAQELLPPTWFLGSNWYAPVQWIEAGPGKIVPDPQPSFSESERILICSLPVPGAIVTKENPQQTPASHRIVVFEKDSSTDGDFLVLQFKDEKPLERIRMLNGSFNYETSSNRSLLYQVGATICREDAGTSPLWGILELSFGAGLRKEICVGPVGDLPLMRDPWGKSLRSRYLQFDCVLSRGELGNAPVVGKLFFRGEGAWRIQVEGLGVSSRETIFPTAEQETFSMVGAVPLPKIEGVMRGEGGMSGRRLISLKKDDFVSRGYAPPHHFAFIGEVRWREVTGAASLQTTGSFFYEDSIFRFGETTARDPAGAPLQMKGEGDWTSFLLPVAHTDILDRDDIPGAKEARWDFEQVTKGSGLVFLRNVSLVEYPDKVWEKLPAKVKEAWGTGPIPLPPRVAPWARWARQVRLGEHLGSAGIGGVAGLLLGAGGATFLFRARRRRLRLQREEELRRIAAVDASEQ